MQITFLGTGTSQGVPVIACHCSVCRSADPRDARLRSSVMIEEAERTIIIDAGPDFRQQLLRAGTERLDGILITHEHKDHVGGLDDVRAFNFIQNKAIDVYARAAIHPVVMREFEYAFSENKYPGVPQIRLHEVNGQPFTVAEISVTPIEALHGQLPVYGYRIGDFAYLTDLSALPETELSKLSGLKVLVVGALRRKAHHSHMNLEQALALISALAPERAYLTHISHYMGLHDEVERELPGRVRLACDGLKIDI
jgi:phosphoribosyl 1,2-cyclic phosphate phosphodiesterase